MTKNPIEHWPASLAQSAEDVNSSAFVSEAKRIVVNRANESEAVQRVYLCNIIDEATGLDNWFKQSHFENLEVYLYFVVRYGDDKPMLMIYPTEVDLLKNKPIIGKVGKTLKKIAPSLNQQQFEATVSLIQARYGGNVKQEILVDETTRGIVQVYKDSGGATRSCMAGNVESSGCGHHPCEVYGDESDIGIAYISETNGDQRRILARALIYRDKKQYGRIYPSDGAHHQLLKDYLLYEGFCKDDFVGAKIKKITANSYDETFVMPYSDGCTRADMCGDFFVYTDDGEFNCQNHPHFTTGDSYICPCCERPYDNDDNFHYIESEDQSICEGCYEGDYFYCGHCDMNHHFDRHNNIETADYEYGYSICDTCLRNNFVRCDDCGEWEERGDEIETNKGDIICRLCYENHCFTCEDCDEVFHIDDMHNHDDKCICQGCLDDNTQECDGCGERFNNDEIERHKGQSLCKDCLDDARENDCGYWRRVIFPEKPWRKSNNLVLALMTYKTITTNQNNSEGVNQ